MSSATEESTNVEGLTSRPPDGAIKVQSPASRPPDGGYGWVIVFGGILQWVFTIPVLEMYGFLFEPKFASCKTSPTEQATFFSVFLALWSITTLLVGPLIKLKSERFVAILGNSLLIAGFIASAFSTNTLHLGISIGLLIGSAFGLINVNVLLIINTWFEKKAGLAISVMLTFNCLGKMAVPQLVKFLMLKFTVQQVFLCYAVFCFTGFVGAVLMRDVTPLLSTSSNNENEIGQHDKLMEEDSEKAIEKQEKGSFCNFWIL